MKKIIFTSAVLLTLVFLAGCAPKYTDVRAAMNEITKDTKEFTVALDKITDAKEAVPVVDAYLDKIRAYIEKMEGFVKIYPELGDLFPPPELKDIVANKKKAVAEKNEVIKKKLEVWTDAELKGKLERLR